MCLKTTRLDTRNSSTRRREREYSGKNARDAADHAGKLMDALKEEKRKAEVLEGEQTNNYDRHREQCV